eukprot:g23676.t1
MVLFLRAETAGVLTWLVSVLVFHVKASTRTCEGKVENTLFIGNSFTFFNEMPIMYQNLVEEAFPDMSVNVEVDAAAYRGLFDPVPSDQKRLLEGKDWDYVILQDHTSTPASRGPRMQESLHTLETFYRPTLKRQKYAKVILFETWGYCGCNGDCKDFLAVNAKLRIGYEKYRRVLSFGENVPNSRKEEGPADSYSVHIAPCGSAFQQVWFEDIIGHRDPLIDGQFKELVLRSKHPSQFGSYVIACVLFTAIHGLSPVGMHYMPEKPPYEDGHPMTLAQKRHAQRLAAQVVLNDTMHLGYSFPYQLCPNATAAREANSSSTEPVAREANSSSTEPTEPALDTEQPPAPDETLPAGAYSTELPSWETTDAPQTTTTSALATNASSSSAAPPPPPYPAPPPLDRVFFRGQRVAPYTALARMLDRQTRKGKRQGRPQDNT